MIYTLSGRSTKTVIKSILVELNEKYMIDHDYMDIESKVELLENIVDLHVIIDKMEEQTNE